MSYDDFLAYTRPRLQSVHPFRQLVGAGTNMHSAWSAGGGGGGGVSGSGHSGYGVEHPDYDYHSGPPANAPSGGSYSYHSTADTGYGVPAPPPLPPHPPPQKGPPPSKKGGGGKKGSSGTSAMTALTLLSFFFFVNLLQSCIKDHMDVMNPTVMVMTTNIRRNRFNKMGEMNSREQNSGLPASNEGTGANLVMQPADMVAAAAANSVVEAMKPELNIQYPFSGIVGSFNPVNPYGSQQNYQTGPVKTQQPASPPAPPQTEVYQPGPLYKPQPPDTYESHKPNAAPLPPPQQQQYYPNPQPPPQSPPQPQSQAYPRPQSFPQPQPQQPITHHQHAPPASPPIFLSPQVESEAQFHYPLRDPHYDQHPLSGPPPHQHFQQQSPSMYTEASPPPSHQHYTTPRNPFYEYQHPPSLPASHNYKDHHDRPPYSMDTDSSSKFSHKPETTLTQHHPHGPVPWSSHTSSVVAGPFRRASIVAVTPSPKWVSVQAANVNDQTDFESEEEETDTLRSNRYGETEYHKKM